MNSFTSGLGPGRGPTSGGRLSSNSPGSMAGSGALLRILWCMGTLLSPTQKAVPGSIGRLMLTAARLLEPQMGSTGAIRPVRCPEAVWWGAEVMEWLRGAVDAVAEIDPWVAAAGHWGKVGLLNAWQTRLSVALQKGNAACLLQAGRVRGSADLQGDTGWKEDIEDLLPDAAPGAGLGVPA